MLKLVYELLKDSFSVTNNVIYNLIITGVIFQILNRFAGSIINFFIKIVMLSLTILILKIAMFIKGIF